MIGWLLIAIPRATILTLPLWADDPNEVVALFKKKEKTDARDG